jgi:penicillin amidase
MMEECTMSRASRIVLLIVAILLVVVAAGSVALVVTVRRPFPQTDGSITVDGLRAEVNVYRDEYGVPHIFAENEEDLYFAQGYVHAQDRFWQMEFWRHLGQGRLAEMLGPDLVETDTFIRTVGWNRMAEDHLAYYEDEAPQMMAVLEAYSAGVNAYLQEQGHAFSLNQTILGLVQEPWEIEPWEPLDTLSWGVVMAWDLGGNWDAELRRAEMNAALGEATTTLLFPSYPHDSRPVIAPTDQLYNGAGGGGREAGDEASEMVVSSPVAWDRVNTSLAGRVPHVGLLRGAGAAASNNWVVSGEHTETGAPLLANDPHLGIQMPSIWYEIGLHGPDHNVSGFSFAGVPGVIIGHNDHIAWGVTNVGPDVQDLFIEKINPNDPQQYEFEGRWRDVDVIEEVIRVNGGEDVTLQVRRTHHGPIINEIIDPQRDSLALRWTAQDENRIFQSVLSLNQARDYEEFREALRYFDTPAQNFVYADVEGNIGYQMPGLVPVREDGDGLVPVPGWTGDYEWDEYVPYEELPALLNPDAGYIVTANNAVTDEEYPQFISHYWASGDRAQRIANEIEAAIAGERQMTAGDFARLQMDGKSLLAESYVPLLDGLSSDDARVQGAIERLRGWDLQMRRDSVPAALFEVFYMTLAQATLADELGQVEDAYLSNSGGSQRVFFHHLATQPGARWWDDVNTEPTETQEEIVLSSLAETVAWFEENVGGDMESWRWGELHTATFVSDPLGQSGLAILERIVNRGPYPVDGSRSTVNATSWSWDEPASVGGHPSMRMVVDLADFDSTRTIHSTGQSGHPFHRHYDDFIPLWQEGETHPLWFGREAIMEGAVDQLTLLPAGE